MTSANDPYQPTNAPPTSPPSAYDGGFGSAPGASPYGGSQYDGGGGPVEKPSSVSTTVKLMFARAAVTVIGVLLAFTQLDTIREQVQKTQPGLSGSQLDAAVNLGLGIAVVIGLLFAGLYVFLGVQVGKGKNWARITTFVVVGIFILLTAIGLLGESPPLNKIINAIALLIDIAIVFFLAKSSEYFNRPQYG